MSFCSGTDCHLSSNHKTFSRPSPLPALLPDALQHLGCYVWWRCQPVMCDRMSWVEWVNQLFFLCQLRHMEPAMARHVSPQSGPCCSRSRAGGQKRRFLSRSISPVSLWFKHVLYCFVMLLLFVYGMQVVDWGLRLLRLSLLLSLFGCFYNTFIFYHSTLLVRGSHDTLGEAESSTIERLARNASWHQRWLKVEWKVVLVKDVWERPSGIANFVEASYC